MLQHLLAVISNLSGAQILSSIGIAVDLGLRMLKSQRPLSILWSAADALRVVAQILGKAAEIADKVLPQRLK